jgi:hypothetical protein
MALARCNFAVLAAGNGDVLRLLHGATITVRIEGVVGNPLLSVPYSDRAGTVSLGNPYVAADGANAGFYAVGGRYWIHGEKDGLEIDWRDVAVGLSQETDFGGGESTVEEFTGATGTISPTTYTAAINRAAPATTALTLPDASLRNGRDLHVGDYSTSVTNHIITLTPHSIAQKIMRQATWQLASNAASLASITLRPIVDPDDPDNFVWVIAT